ncbi:MAG: phosphomannomutase/phosphoglucomutase [Nanoarchaeota archaeon]|nr:phosphomannomutase/phosphoglucomutase [Nanoarchaeota archaeon]
MGVYSTYDIRGLYPAEINEELAYKVGRAFVTFLECKKVVVGRDGRTSSPSLQKALMQGIIDQGADVFDIGLTATPLMNFAAKDYDAGIMISASHNPGQYNAFKLVKRPVLQMHTKELQIILDLAEKNEFVDAEITGNIIELNPINEYAEHVLKKCDFSGLKVVVDYGNGVGSVIAKPVFDKLDIEVISLYEEIDGTFPNHPANPHDIENLVDLQKAVKENDADLGIFFDGDADRSQLVDETGEILMPDILLALLVPEELGRFPGSNVYYDLRFSKIVKDVILENGGNPYMLKVGNPFFKEKMLTGGCLAGELSGHIMFKDHFSIDDGLYAAVKLMNLLSKCEWCLSELVQPLKRYFSTPEINLKVDNADEVLKIVEGNFLPGKHLILDGVHVTFSDWWFSLRKSNNEPLVRLRLEADTKELMNQKKDEILKIINSN